MTVAAIRNKLTDYLQNAPDKKVKALYTLLERDIELCEQGMDEAFFKELDRRSKSFEDGTAKTYTLEEARKAAIESLRANDLAL